jgi:hypothetical protein
MRKSLLASLAALMLVSACGSRLNPFNWFGGREAREQRAARDADDLESQQDQRLLVEQVTRVAVEPMAGGVILRATGLPPTQGYWDAELVALPIDENGVLAFEFRIFPPVTQQPVSTVVSREVVVATVVSDIRLAQVSGLAVVGARNSVAARP